MGSDPDVASLLQRDISYKVLNNGALKCSRLKSVLSQVGTNDPRRYTKFHEEELVLLSVI